MKNSTHEIPDPLKKFAQIIGTLDTISFKLIEVMDQQIDAVVASDTDRIKQLAEQHIDLKGVFRQQEQLFVKELRGQLVGKGIEADDIKLDALKQSFPDSAALIDQWKAGIQKNAMQLKKMHQQLSELLEFALSRNTEMMRSIYSIYNRKNTHYSATGGTNELSSGMAVNQEV